MTAKARTQSVKVKRRPGKVGRPPKGAEEAISEQIIEVAARLFAAQGFAATSVEQIVSACGAGKDTIYRRYPSKQALFEGVLKHAHKRTLAKLEVTLSEGGDVLTRLRRVARWFLAANVDPELVAFRRIFFSEVQTLSNRALKPDNDPILLHLVSLISEAQQAKVLKAGDPKFIANQLILAIATGPSLEAMLGHETYTSPDTQNAYFTKAWRLFMAGAAQ